MPIYFQVEPRPEFKNSLRAGKCWTVPHSPREQAQRKESVACSFAITLAFAPLTLLISYTFCLVHSLIS